jgi:hypothetical protein
MINFAKRRPNVRDKMLHSARRRQYRLQSAIVGNRRAIGEPREAIRECTEKLIPGAGNFATILLA